MKTKQTCLCLLLAAVLLLGGCNPLRLFNTQKKPTEDTGKTEAGAFQLPDLVGQTFVDEESFLEQYPALASLEISVTRQWDDESRENAILSTEPKAMTRMTPGSTLTIVVSRGAHVVEIPQIVTDETADSYIARLQNLGFEVVRKTTPSKDVVKDYVIQCEPSYPASVPYGSSITVYVSSGVDGEDASQGVPSVKQMSEETARATLEAAGFVVGTVTAVNHSTYAAGMVIEQEPAANTTLPAGSVVNLQIASGYCDVPLALSLPQTNNMISLQVFIDGRMQTSPEYSSDVQGILPSAVPYLSFTFREQIASYNVTFRIKDDTMSGYQIYASYTLNGLTGEWVQDAFYPLTTAAPTTTTEATTVTTTTAPQTFIEDTSPTEAYLAY